MISNGQNQQHEHGRRHADDHRATSVPPPIICGQRTIPVWVSKNRGKYLLYQARILIPPGVWLTLSAATYEKLHSRVRDKVIRVDEYGSDLVSIRRSQLALLERLEKVCHRHAIGAYELLDSADEALGHLDPVTGGLVLAAQHYAQRAGFKPTHVTVAFDRLVKALEVRIRPDGSPRTKGNLISRTHVNTVRSRIKVFTKRFGHLLVTDLSALDINQWMWHLITAEVYSDRTVYNIRKEFVRLLKSCRGNFAPETWLVPDKIDPIKVLPVIHDCYSYDDGMRIVQTLRKHNVELSLIFELCCRAGVRNDEVDRLLWGDVMLDYISPNGRPAPYLNMRAEITKTGILKKPPIFETLFDQLRTFRGPSNQPVCRIKDWEAKVARVLETIGMKWLKNGERRLFACAAGGGYGSGMAIVWMGTGPDYFKRNYAHGLFTGPDGRHFLRGPIDGWKFDIEVKNEYN